MPLRWDLTSTLSPVCVLAGTCASVSWRTEAQSPLGQEGNASLTRTWRMHGISFPPRGENSTQLENDVPRATVPEAVLLLQGQDSWDHLSQACYPPGTCGLWQGHLRVYPHYSQNREARNQASVPPTPPAGDPGQNQSTEKVERLKDNQRGFSVVIYNRDCKMVNQI